jgi:hypothetical protein
MFFGSFYTKVAKCLMDEVNTHFSALVLWMHSRFYTLSIGGKEISLKASGNIWTSSQTNTTSQSW